MPPVSMTRLYEAIFDEPPPAMTAEEEADWLNRLERVLDTLSPREAFVVRERYLRDPRPTQAELAALYEVSNSRIGQVERRALEKLRHPSRRRFLLGDGDLTALPWSEHPCWGRAPVKPRPPVCVANLELRDRLLLDVRDLEISVRVANCFDTAGITFIGDLVGKTEADLLRIRNFGRRSLREIKALLANLGLSLGMKTRGWARMKARKAWRMGGMPDDGPTEEGEP